MTIKLPEFNARLNNPRERIYLPELFSAVSKEKVHATKIAMLRAYAQKNSEHANLIRDFVQCVYHPSVVFDLPETDPPFKTDYVDYSLAPLQLRQAFQKVPYFVKGHSKYLENKVKREQIFIQTLEGMYKDDADLFLMVKNKKFNARKYKTINEALFREAFPGMLPNEESTKS